LEQRSAQAQSPSRRLGQRRGPPATDAFKWLGDCRMVVCELCRRLRVGELAECQWQPVVAEMLTLDNTATSSQSRSDSIPGAPL